MYTLPSPAAPGALFLPFIHVFPSSVASLAAVVFFSLSLILCIPETHYLTRPNGMNGQKREKRAEERDATATQRTERRNERKRRRRRDAARLDETVNTAASTAESGLYHMQRPRRDGEGGLDQRGPTLPNKANT